MTDLHRLADAIRRSSALAFSVARRHDDPGTRAAFDAASTALLVLSGAVRRHAAGHPGALRDIKDAALSIWLKYGPVEPADDPDGPDIGKPTGAPHGAARPQKRPK